MGRWFKVLTLTWLVLACQRSESRSAASDVGVLVPGGDGYLLYRANNAVVIKKCPPLTSFFNKDGSLKTSDELSVICNQGTVTEDIGRFKTNLAQSMMLSSNLFSADDKALVEKYKVGVDSTEFDLLRQQRREVQQELEPILTFLRELELAGVPDPSGNLSVEQLTKKVELERKLKELDGKMEDRKGLFAVVEEINNRINKLVDSLISSPDLDRDRLFIFSRDGQSFFYNILAGYLRTAPVNPKPTEPTKPTQPEPIVPPTMPSVDVEAQLKFVTIKAGSFVMGSLSSEKGRSPDEQAHGVNIRYDFELMSFEVTQQNWFDVMGDNPAKFRTDKDCAAEHKTVNGVSLCPRHPVESVSWDRVQEFLRRMTEKSTRYRYRLPTEAEWEWAARAGTKTMYPFGDNDWNLKNVAWHEANSNLQTHQVGFLGPTGGSGNFPKLFDMFGNVWEWTSDWYAPHPEIEETNPTGPATGTEKVIRGCSWSANANACRSAKREHEKKENSSSVIGFRMVRTPK